MLGVAEVAAELGLSPRRVRQMLASGDLPGERVGRSWLVERSALDALANRAEVGRPWRPGAAWSFLALAQGESVELSPVDRLRIGRRVDQGIEPNLARLRVRADRRSFFAHPSVLGRLLDRREVIRSGVSAAVDYSVDLIAVDVAEGYVRLSAIDGLVQEFALDESSGRPNLILRVVSDEVWPFGDAAQVAPLAVVAVDLLEAADERSQRAGTALWGRL